MADDEKPVIELIPPMVPAAEELHGWGLIRRIKMTRAELLAKFPRPKEK